MAENVFAHTPLQNALGREAAAMEARKARGILPTTATTPPSEPLKSAPSAPEAPKTPRLVYEDASSRYGVQANLIRAVAEMAKIPDDQAGAAADRIGETLSGPIKQGMKASEALRSLFPDAPEGFEQAVVTRANEIFAADYAPAETPAAPEEDGSFVGDAARTLGGSLVRGVGSAVRGVGDAIEAVNDATRAPFNALTGQDVQGVHLTEDAADIIQSYAKGIGEGVSEDAKQAIRDSSPDGDLFRPSTWTVGEKPSLKGYSLLALDVFGSLAPVVAAAYVSGPTAAAGVGGLQGGGAGGEAAGEMIDQMAAEKLPDGRSRLEVESAYYREMVAAGLPAAAALRRTKVAAARMGFIFTAPISTLGGAATGVILQPATKIAARSGLAGRVAGRVALGALEEGSQEAAETIAARSGGNVGAGTNESVSDGTFGDFLLGAMGGAGPAAVSGALSSREEAPVPAAEGPAQPVADSVETDGLPAQDVVSDAGVESPKGPLSNAMKGAPAALAPDIRPGDRVTLRATDISPIEGTFVSEEPDGVVVRADGEDLLIPREEFDRGAVSIQPFAPAPDGLAAEAAPAAPAPREEATTELTPEAAADRLTYIQEQARANGWNGRLVAERQRLEAIINPPPPAPTPTEAVTRKDGSAFKTLGQAMQAVRSRGFEVEAFSFDRQADGGIIANPKQADMGVPISEEPAPAPAEVVAAPAVSAVPAQAETGAEGEAAPVSPNTEPPVSPGFVRMYHGTPGADGERADAGGDRWFSSSRNYARDYRGGGDEGLWYVDVPRSDPMFAEDVPGQTVDQGFTVNKDFDPALYGGAKRVIETSAAATGASDEGETAAASAAPVEEAEPLPASSIPKKLAFTDFLRALPKDPSGKPDVVGAGTRALEGIGSESGDWNNLTDEQRASAIELAKAEKYVPRKKGKPAAAPKNIQGASAGGEPTPEASAPAQPVASTEATEPPAASTAEAAPSVPAGGETPPATSDTGPDEPDPDGSPTGRAGSASPEASAEGAASPSAPRPEITQLREKAGLIKGITQDQADSIARDLGISLAKTKQGFTFSWKHEKRGRVAVNDYAGSGVGAPARGQSGQFHAPVDDGRPQGTGTRAAEADTKPAAKEQGRSAPDLDVMFDEILDEMAPETPIALYNGGRSVDIAKASDDAEFVLEPDDYSLDWRAVDAFPLSMAPAGAGVRDDALANVREAGDAALSSPILLLMDEAGKLSIADGQHRIAVAKERGKTTLPAIIGRRAASIAKTSTPEEIKAARKDVEDRPTEAQKEAGNYAMGHIKVHGLDVTIETRKGGWRRGMSPNGTEWKVRLPADYGYIRRTEGADGDHVDVYVGPEPEADRVYVFDQMDPGTLKFDEHKVVMGVADHAQARVLYDAGFSDGSGPHRRMASTMMTVDAFKAWLAQSDKRSPAWRTVPKMDGGVGVKARTMSYNIPDEEMAKQGQLRAAGAAASSAVKNAAMGLDEATKGLLELFGGNRLSSGLTFDREAYEKAKPLFIAAAQHFKAAAGDIREVMGAVMKHLMASGLDREGLRQMQPYVVEFTKEVGSGAISLDAEEPADAEPAPAGSAEGVPAFTVFMEQEVGKKWMIGRRTDHWEGRGHRAFLSRKQFDALTDEWIARGGDPRERGTREAMPEAERKRVLDALRKEVGPLYVKRPVLNGEEIVAWAREQGFKTTLAPEDMHVTIAFSRAPVAFGKGEGAPNEAGRQGEIESRPEQLGDRGAVVLPIPEEAGGYLADELSSDWGRYQDRGASWDFPSYRPHITITYDAGSVDLAKVEPFRGTVRLGTEMQEPLDPDAGVDVPEVPTSGEHHSASQPRDEDGRFIEEEATPASAADEAESEAAPSAKIEDFGEKIHGARKDEWVDYAERLRLAGTLDSAKEPLSKIWPAPDYAAMVASGAESWAVSTVRALREAVPVKPRAHWRVNGWVKDTEALRDLAGLVLKGEAPRPVLETMVGDTRTGRKILGKAELYLAVGHSRSLDGLELAEASYSMWRGERFPKPKTMWTVEVTPKAGAGFSNMPRSLVVADTKDEAIAGFKEKFATLPEDSPTKKRERSVRVDLYSRDKRQTWRLGIKVGSAYIDLKTFETVEEARAYRQDHYDDLVAQIEKMRDIPSERKATNSPRVGQDHRNGADVTPERFAETFGFRGVQFGNWVEGDRRQADLNEAYDALLDLAGILGVPARALSLNGELGLAFGARGKGGKGSYAAHYEPVQVVINLTKKQGAGSLAHEWFHALDNYFARARGNPLEFVTDRRGGPGITSPRAEVRDAFRDVKEALDKTDLRARSQRLDRMRTKPYFGTGIEMHARAFESYVIAKLEDQGASNDYLANIVSEAAWQASAAMQGIEGASYPYLIPGEVPAVRDAFDGLFRAIETRETEKGVALYAVDDDSTAEKPFASTAALREHLVALPGIGKFVRQLIEAGFIKLEETPPENENPKTAGSTYLITKEMDPNLPRRVVSRIRLFSSNITPETAAGVALHEIFHAGGERLLGGAWDPLMARAESIRAAQQKKATDPNHPRFQNAEEFAAYALQYYEQETESRAGLREVLDRMIGELKAFVLRHFGRQIGQVTTAEFRAIAAAALRAEAKRRGAAAKARQTRASSEPEAARHSRLVGPARNLDERVDDAVAGRRKNEPVVVGGAPEVLTALGAPAAPVIITNAVVEKALAKHRLSEGEVKAALRGLYAPVMVFDSAPQSDGPEGSLVVAVEVLSDGRPVTLALHLNRSIGKTEITNIASVNARRSSQIRLWIEDGLTRYVGKRAGQWLSLLGLQLPRAVVLRHRLGTKVLQHADVFKGEAKHSIADQKSFKAPQPAPAMTDAQIDEGERSMIGNALTKAMEGDYGILGLVPGRPLFAELAKGMPAARQYLHQKLEMDALRNHWHARTDEVAQAWRKLGAKSKANADLMDIMHDATLLGADPSQPYVSMLNDKDREALDGPRGGPAWDIATERAEKDAAKKRAWRALKERFDALPPAFKAMFERVRDTYKEIDDATDKAILDNIEKSMERGLRDAERRFKDEMARIRDEGLTGADKIAAETAASEKFAGVKKRHGWSKRARMAKLRAQFEMKKVPAPYFPLARFGSFFVTTRDAETGEVLGFSTFEKPKEQNAFARAERAKDGVTVEVGTLAQAGALRGMVDPVFVADVEAILGDSGVGEGIMDAIWQRWLETLPDLSLRKSKIHRKGTPGFSRDAFRAFGHQMFHGAHQLARLTFAAEMQESLDLAKEQVKNQPDPVRAGLVHQEMARRHDYTMNPKGAWWAQVMTSAAFVYFLAMTPAAAIVNLSQTTVVGIPILAAGFPEGSAGANVAMAGRNLLRALHDFTAGRGHSERTDRLTQDEKDALAEAYRRGTVDASQAHDLAGVGETGVEYSPLRTRVMGVISWFFHNTERLNREVTFLAAYRMGRAKGMDHMSSVEKAFDLTWKTHFDYQNTSRPRLMQNDAARVALTFRNFSVNMLWRLFRDVHQSINAKDPAERKEAMTQLGGITAQLFLHAGIKGVWGYSIAIAIAGLFFAGGGDDAEDELKKAVLGALGTNLGGMALNGVPGHLTGLDLTNRMGMPDLWFRSPDRQLEGEDAYHYWLTQLVGAPFGIAENGFRGAQMIREGETWRGVETMAPKFVRDLMRATRYATDGVQTMKGDPILEEVDFGKVLAQALGFTPAAISERYDANSKLKNAEERITEERGDLMARAAAEVREGKSLSQATIDDIMVFNRHWPTYPITSDSLKQSIRGRIRASARNESGIMLNPRLNDTLRDSAAPLVYE